MEPVKRGVGPVLGLGLGFGTNPNSNLSQTLKRHSLKKKKDRPRPRPRPRPCVLLTPMGDHNEQYTCQVLENGTICLSKSLILSLDLSYIKIVCRPM